MSRYTEGYQGVSNSLSSYQLLGYFHLLAFPAHVHDTASFSWRTEKISLGSSLLSVGQKISRILSLVWFGVFSAFLMAKVSALQDTLHRGHRKGNFFHTTSSDFNVQETQLFLNILTLPLYSPFIEVVGETPDSIKANLLTQAPELTEDSTVRQLQGLTYAAQSTQHFASFSVIIWGLLVAYWSSPSWRGKLQSLLFFAHKEWPAELLIFTTEYWRAPHFSK